MSVERDLFKVERKKQNEKYPLYLIIMELKKYSLLEKTLHMPISQASNLISYYTEYAVVGIPTLVCHCKLFLYYSVWCNTSLM